MSHSNRLKLHWLFVVAEIGLFIAAVVTAYFSEVNSWSWFVIVSIVAVIIFAALKIVDACPMARELLVREDFAAKIARSSLEYGINQYFNMQSAEDQALRNKLTQKEIAEATGLCLCANSGTSYLDPAIYRHWSFIEERLNAGVNFRVVLLDPFSAEKAFRNQLNVGGESFDSKLNIANLIKLYNSFPLLEIRFVRYGMHSTVFATEKSLFFDPYHVGINGNRIENRSFSLFIKPSHPQQGIGLYRLFRSHFDTLWRAGDSIEEWIEEVHDKLPKDLPALKSRQYTV